MQAHVEAGWGGPASLIAFAGSCGVRVTASGFALAIRVLAADTPGPDLILD